MWCRQSCLYTTQLPRPIGREQFLNHPAPQIVWKQSSFLQRVSRSGHKPKFICIILGHNIVSQSHMSYVNRIKTSGKQSYTLGNCDHKIFGKQNQLSTLPKWQQFLQLFLYATLSYRPFAEYVSIEWFVHKGRTQNSPPTAPSEGLHPKHPRPAY